MSRVADRCLVAGVGLIGGSLALAARERGLIGECVGFGRTRENLELARSRGIVDRIATGAAEAMAGVDLVLLATPVGSCAALASTFRPHARPGTILTDAGSVKATVVDGMEAAWTGVGPVVGAHPIAGSEASGAGAARADLFVGRRCILTPTARTDAAALRTLRRLWEGVGAIVEELSPATHDEILARVSHLPHVIAYALVRAAGAAQVDGRDVLAYAGSGFRDTTRIAASRAELWRDILMANGTAVGSAVREFCDALDAIASAVSAGDAATLDSLLGDAERRRRALGGAE